MKMKARKKKILRGRALNSECDSGGGDGGGGGVVLKPPLAMRKGIAAVSLVKSRKELRKELRKAKKSQKHQYLLTKCGRADLVKKACDGIGGKKKKKKKKKKRQARKTENKSGGDRESGDEEGVGGSTSGDDKAEDAEDFDEVAEFVNDAKTKMGVERVDPGIELRREQEKLKKEMEEVRRKRLIEENEEEERNINQLTKKLKLNKKAIIPESFRTDGLDYVLEICEQTSGSKMKKKANNASSSDESDDDDGKRIEVEEKDGSSDFDDFGSDIGNDDDDENIDEFGEEEDESADELNEACFGLDKDDLDSSDVGEEMDNDSTNVSKMKKSKIKENEEGGDGVWEDIYGRLRSKDGAVISHNVAKTVIAKDSSENSGKYIPPMLRGGQKQREKIAKQLKGLLNRISESNMHSISNQVEELYMANSRNEMNLTLLELLNAALVRQTVMPERVVLEHVMLIAILHANVGTEVGAFFIQSFAQAFKSKYDNWLSNPDDDDKQLENLAQIISFIFHFKIVDACLIYDILKFLGDSFAPKDIELILTILKNVGFRLRKNDPAALKELIITLQQKASKQQAGTLEGGKIKFMLEILMAIRNNNMNKIPNYDPSFGDHLLKLLKSHLRPGNYVSEMKIGLTDLLNANTTGRWWIVGSAWTGKNPEGMPPQDGTAISSQISSEDASQRVKLLKRARAQGMNTDTRRNIFCVLMSAEDYLDAFEKLNHLDLRNNQDREIIHVTVYCCLQEKKYNPYYGFIVSKFCSVDRKLMYPACFKEEVRIYAAILGQRKTSRLFSISQKRICEWITEAKQLPNSSLCTRAAVLQTRRKNLSKIRKSLTYYTGPGVPPTPSRKEVDLAVEAEVQKWICRHHPRKMTSFEVRKKAKEVYRKHGHLEMQCSYGWYRRFQARLASKQFSKRDKPTPHQDDSIVITWLLQMYDNNLLISYKDLQSFARNAFREKKPTFKASAGWASRFLKRNHVVINWEGLYTRTLPSHLEIEINHFQSEVGEIFKNVSPNAIGCMDEIPLSFSGHSKKHAMDQVDDLECRLSNLKKLSVKNCDATVILGMLADGTFLPPMIIVKGQLSSSINQVYNTPESPIVTYYNSTTEPTLHCLLRWVELVWNRNTTASQTSVLILDSYDVHQQLKERMETSSFKCMVIPSGCSLKLQPLNVLAKMTFLQEMDRLWLLYLKHNEDCVERIRLPSTNEVVEWVQKSYEATKRLQEDLTKSFNRIFAV